ncbi:MAG: hypothetical protein OEY51_08840 [Cyclobacteriaceae bacterium]|nr:hypothetical protein [Cyclobacteriaceae bacterium]
MDVLKTKKHIHTLIDQIENNDILEIYLKLLKEELKKNTYKEPFNNTEDDMSLRAKLSLQSVINGKTRSIKEFKKDIDKWKKNRVTK